MSLVIGRSKLRIVQAKRTTTVDGIVEAQYTQNLLVMIFGPPQSSDGTAKSAAKKVPGRKTMVMTAIIFIEPLSRLDASACRFEIRAKICSAKGESISLYQCKLTILNRGTYCVRLCSHPVVQIFSLHFEVPDLLFA